MPITRTEEYIFSPLAYRLRLKSTRCRMTHSYWKLVLYYWSTIWLERDYRSLSYFKTTHLSVKTVCVYARKTAPPS
jgi:hypothetical protein